MSSRLALVVIARNEQRCIERCLRSVAPFVDDMLVVDTGSTDATVQIAEACGARVLHFDWVDDFSAARNFALDHCAADWCLVLDADEWLDQGGAELAALRQAPAQPPFVGQLEVRSEFDARTGGAQGEVHSASSWISRLLPRGVHYEGRIHEQPVHSLPVKRMNVRIGHDGYRELQRQAKRARNQHLLQMALREHPDDAYLLYQSGKDLETAEDFVAAVPLYLRALTVLRQEADAAAQAPAWLHDLVVRLMFSLKSAGHFEAAVQLAEREMPHWQNSPDFYFALGDLLLDWAIAQPQRSSELLPMIEGAWQRCLLIGEAPYLEGAVRGRGSFLAAHNLAVFHASLGHEEQAQAFHDTAQRLRSQFAVPV